MLKYLQLRMGVNFNRVAPVNVIPTARARILLIHGDRDTVVPVQEGKRLLHAGNPDTARLWVVPDKGHSDCHEHPDFFKLVDTFLREAFMAEGSVDTFISVRHTWRRGKDIPSGL